MNFNLRIDRIMEAIDRIIQLTTIETLRSFDCRSFSGPTNQHVQNIRRALLSYYEDHHWPQGSGGARSPIQYVFEEDNATADYDDILWAENIQEFMNQGAMLDVLERPSRLTNLHSLDILYSLYWKEREYRLPYTNDEILLDYFRRGVDSGVFDDRFKPWTDKGYKRLL